MNMLIKPKVITVCGPTCSGKTTLATHMTTSGQFREAVSVTTRARRANEKDGVDYHFCSPVDFAERQANDEFIEVNRFGVNYYGSLKSEFRSILEGGSSLVVVIEPYGAINVRRFCQDEGIDVVSAYIECALPTALDRLAMRFLHDRIKIAGADAAYADRFLKLILMEPHWRAAMRYDIVFEGSSDLADIKSIQTSLQNQKASQLSTRRMPLSVETAMRYAEDSLIPLKAKEMEQFLRETTTESASNIAKGCLAIVGPVLAPAKSMGNGLVS